MKVVLNPKKSRIFATLLDILSIGRKVYSSTIIKFLLILLLINYFVNHKHQHSSCFTTNNMSCMLNF